VKISNYSIKILIILSKNFLEKNIDMGKTCVFFNYLKEYDER